MTGEPRTTALAEKVRQRITRNLPGALGEDVDVTAVEAAGHHVRAHAVAWLSGLQGHCRLFLKMVTTRNLAAELFAHDVVLPNALCRSARLLARFPDWEQPTVWLALEYVDGRWASFRDRDDTSAVLSQIAGLHATGFQDKLLAETAWSARTESV